jgi:hypothetical protein
VHDDPESLGGHGVVPLTVAQHRLALASLSPGC